MPITIGSNLASLRAQRRLNEGSETLSRVYERLSSGQRINRASDDAAGLAVSMSLNANARVYNQALRNVNDGISFLSVAEGALKELGSITQRQLELAEQAANGVYSSKQREALQNEADALTNEYNRIIEGTEYNGTNLLNVGNSGRELRLQLGYGVQESISFAIGSQLTRVSPDGTFGASSFYTTEFGVIGIGTGDLNGDGKIDAVEVAGGGSQSVRIFLGNGNGSFKKAVSYAASGGSLRDVDVLDVNGDNVADVVAVDGTRLAVYLGNGNGTFLDEQVYSTGGGSGFNLAVGDLNRDGKIDAIATSGTSVSILLGNGNGSFSVATTYDFGSGAEGLEISDFNRDGLLDFVTTRNDTTMVIGFGRGDGTFTLSSRNVSTPHQVGVGDINNDGLDDIITVSSSGGFIGAFLNNGNGTFGAQITFAAGSDPRYVRLADVNDDNNLDAIVANVTPDTTSILLGNGNGSFGTPNAYPTGGNSFGPLTLDDFNADGALDLATPSLSGGMSIRLGNTTLRSSAQTVDLTNAVSSRTSLDQLHDQLNRISGETGAIGAIQSRLSIAASNLTSLREMSLQASARIQDADMAEEAALLTRTQILQQAASAVLAQANQQPALALQLLKGG